VVDERSEADRVEIELTTHVPVTTSGRRRRFATKRTDEPDDAEARRPRQPLQWLASEHGHLAVTAVGVGVVALLLGWMLGRAGGADGIAAPAGTSTTTTTTVARVPSNGPFVSLETLPDASFPVTPSGPTTSRSTTTTTPESTLELIEIDDRLDGVPVTLVGFDSMGRLVELDLEHANLRRRPDAGRYSIDQPLLAVGDGWVVAPNQNNGRTTVIFDDGTIEGLNVDGWQLLWVEGTDRFWRTDTSNAWGTPTRLTEVDISGEPTGATVELPGTAWAFLADPNGGLVVTTSGRTYRVNPDGVELIGNGELLGLSRDVAVLRSCDEQLRCGVSVVDRATGSVRGLPFDASLDPNAVFESTYNWGSNRTSPISPDGRWCGVMAPGTGPPEFGLLDLETGEFTALSTDTYPVSIVWSADSRFAFYLETGVLHARDTTIGESFPVSVAMSRWTGFGGRQNAPDVSPTTEQPVEG
jgi:hypothetical protein